MRLSKNNKKKVIIEKAVLTRYGKDSVLNAQFFKGGEDRLCYSFKIDEPEAQEFRNYWNEFNKDDSFTKKFFIDESCNYLNFKCRKSIILQNFNDEVPSIGDEVELLLGLDDKGSVFLNGLNLIKHNDYNPFDI